ncbi:hypothetical protein SLEP1_g51078 [Rubroshorea leprosula]|uniref:Uncharacterized protein n=1 Tax=Rubroshorea leprosula TaxID=152421 RepID=A0AAV5M4K7_9ROSI|nr:hypothetical protein SLEP1_g51078 [Rubroshorea leprosula]
MCNIKTACLPRWMKETGTHYLNNHPYPHYSLAPTFITKKNPSMHV